MEDRKTNGKKIAPLFNLGRIVATPRVAEIIPVEDVIVALGRHVQGDWGEVADHDWKENQFALENELQLFSVYHSKQGVRFYVITEADRSSTTTLLPEDY